jgi:NAD(P)H-dependent flavin oxidoreductase YrpB (nitropropane dioxygenase family)
MTWSEPDVIAQALGRMRDLTDRPFGVNLILRTPQEERLRQVLDAGVRIVSLFWGDPAPLIPIAHDAGAIVLHTVGSAAEAERVVESGVDVVVAQGWEAGGHVWGDVASLPLVPRVVDAVAPTPVVAAGGIGDGRGVAAVLALGAGAAWLGTRFVMTAEVAAHPRYRELLAAATETDTVHSSLFDIGWPDAPHRTPRNCTFERWVDAGRPRSGDRPGEGDVVARTAEGSEVVRYASSSPRAELEGDIEATSMWAGQSAGLVETVSPAGDVVRHLAEEAAQALRSATELIRD